MDLNELRNAANALRNAANELDKTANNLQIMDSRISELERCQAKDKDFKTKLMELLKEYGE